MRSILQKQWLNCDPDPVILSLFDSRVAKRKTKSSYIVAKLKLWRLVSPVPKLKKYSDSQIPNMRGRPEAQFVHPGGKCTIERPGL